MGGLFYISRIAFGSSAQKGHVRARVSFFATPNLRSILLQQNFVGSSHKFNTKVKSPPLGRAFYFGAGSRTRTYEAERREIYSLL